MSDLAIIPATALVPAEVFKPGGVDALLESIATKARAMKPDVSTRQGRAEIASLALKVAKSKTLLDEMGKELVSDWKTRSAAVDAERRKVREFLDALKEEVRAPLTQYEQAEAARIAAHEEALADLIESPNYGAVETAADLAARLAWLRNPPPRKWEEFAQRAADTLAAEIDRTEALHEAAVKREAEAAELARLRAEEEARRQEEAARAQAEREARIAEEAAAKAKQAAEEAAERQRAEAARKAEAERQAVERERAAAEDRARKAEEARVAAEQRAEREKAEAVAAEQRRVAAAKAAEEAEAARRAANTAHKAKINRDVLAALVACGAPDDVGKAIVGAIARGEVPHVSIAY
jgi:colicin import membrane protein